MTPQNIKTNPHTLQTLCYLMYQNLTKLNKLKPTNIDQNQSTINEIVSDLTYIINTLNGGTEK